MVPYALAPLDASFAALSDATRRGVLERLERAEASISELAEAFAMTLTGMKKHGGLEAEAAWIARYRARWEARFDALDKVVAALKEQERKDGADGKQ
jgi:DNA-binding transcriptional ArsR family regulator